MSKIIDENLFFIPKLWLSVTGIFFCLLSPYCIANADESSPPNIILLLIDDQGWTDLGAKMNSQIVNSSSDYYETPNIDRLANQSLIFSNGYSPSPICTPSRASILTGKSPQLLGFTDIPESRPGSRRFSDLYTGKKLIPPQPLLGLPQHEMTIAEMLKDQVKQDYASAHFGKWHVGGGGPGVHGFEIHDGSTGNHNFNAHGEDPNPKDVFGVTGRAISFMKSQVYSKRPFFMQISHYANHVPLRAMKETIEKYRAKDKGERHTNPVYGALNENLDTSVGKLIEALKELNIDNNTYIFYTSDNGGSKNIKKPSTNNEPLREGKTWVYEGGIRVPFMVSGPGIKPGESAVPVIGWDLFPTFCAIVQCQYLPKGLEGGNLMPILLGQQQHVARASGDALFWHFPHYLTSKGTTPQSAVRLGRYKLIEHYHTGQTFLYDLENDIEEKKDVSLAFPQITSRLKKLLSDYLNDINAGLPVKNNYLKTDFIAPTYRVSSTWKNIQLNSKHTSVISKFSYSIPRGWVVTDGETDWLAPSMRKQFWETDFEAENDSFYAISRIPTYLSFEDKQKQQHRSLHDIVASTVHSIQVSTSAKVKAEPHTFVLNGKAAQSFVAQLNATTSMYQLFVQYSEEKIVTVSGTGPHKALDDMSQMVTAIAASIEFK